ncbi:MAG TPA: hypothetical protein H9746_09690 [Candidatus Butyricicoccus avistercoris]|uniref:Radical SAM protein n=1 Tax=Candidatus Butyricicoccus avistercoris TaxID=2838518 RepID=A0A9D1TJJ7_9FIRM|nr:hypothetical protein [Candidatus Butyricicoccus avistercoris]
MNRKVLLVEPNYKNKYPPMGLMKLATYYRQLGDDVRFFKGDLKDLAADLVIEELIENLYAIDANTKWEKYKLVLIEYIRKSKITVLDECNAFVNNVMAYQLVKDARLSYRKKEYLKNPPFDKVGITTLFTFYWDITIDTINFVKKLCKNEKDVMVGGIMSTLLPEEVYQATGIRPFVGLLNHPGDIDEGNKTIIDELPLDYSILEEIDYKYPANDAYFAYMTRGCINNCAFCAVPTLEPTYFDYVGLKEQIKMTKERFGEQRNLLLLDNNVLASKYYNKIIDEIKECGFYKGATYVPSNQYEITIKNLKDGFNDRAYIRKSIKLYKLLMEKLSVEEKTEFYLKLEELDCLHHETATKEAILYLDDYVAPLYGKYFKHKRGLKRIVDFNQGIDARLITDENMMKLSEVNIYPLRIAFDHWEQKDIYEKAIKIAVKNGITNLSNYMLYNFKDRPEHLYYRMKLNVELCDELGANIYSFPMKYHPINDPEFFMNRDFIGKHWNRKFIRAIQAVLNSTKGKVGRGKEFFEEAFGSDEHRFWTILWMPETFIIYRFMFKDNLAKEWEEKFWNLPEEKMKQVQNIVATNQFRDLDMFQFDEQIREVLTYYKFTRDEAETMIQMQDKISNN